MKKYVNGQYLEMTDDEIAESSAVPTNIYSRIASLKAMLAETDYKAIKYAEGLISEEEYATTKAQRQTWRETINQLECAEA